jgi:hypothetical protein
MDKKNLRYELELASSSGVWKRSYAEAAEAVIWGHKLSAAEELFLREEAARWDAREDRMVQNWGKSK